MSWMAKLYETYEAAIQDPELSKDLEPFYHKKEKCHIEIVIDSNGQFLRAKSLLAPYIVKGKEKWRAESTVIPITPKSLTGRTSGAAPYPLAERIQYIAQDYGIFGGKKDHYFSEYFSLLNEWAESIYTNKKIIAVKKYIEKGSVVADLLSQNLLFTFNENGKLILISDWGKQSHLTAYSKKPSLFLLEGMKDQGNVMVRWSVEIKNEPDSNTWNDEEIIRSWQLFQAQKNLITDSKKDFCQILGKSAFIADTHSKGILPKANNAKLISAPTNSSYLTYQGRFAEVNQVCGISFEVSQKVHSALKWLISRQGFLVPSRDSAIVAWAVSGKPIPKPIAASYDLIDWSDLEEITVSNDLFESKKLDHSSDLGQSFALKLNKKMAGYLAQLDELESIVIMAIDSATPGRMGITYYRECFAKEFIERIESWHFDFAWMQRYITKLGVVQLVSAPAPYAIAEAAYGKPLPDNLKKNFFQRLMPCIVEGQTFPIDLVNNCIKAATNRASYDSETRWVWEKNLGVACALYRGFYRRHPIKVKRRNYAMSLEMNNNSRDYLYGRLLAVAERIEQVSLKLSGEKRMTNAERLMQRFADRPYSTWLTIELQLKPYMQKLQNNRPGFLVNQQKRLDEIMNAFNANDFASDQKLSGEFLLGYHCQRQYSRDKTKLKAVSNKTEDLITAEEMLS